MKYLIIALFAFAALGLNSCKKCYKCPGAYEGKICEGDLYYGQASQGYIGDKNGNAVECHEVMSL